MTQDKENILSKKQKELQDIRKHVLRGQFVRSKAIWIDEGEKPTNYFLSLESRNYINKQVPQILMTSLVF